MKAVRAKNLIKGIKPLNLFILVFFISGLILTFDGMNVNDSDIYSFAEISSVTEVQMGKTVKVGLKYGNNAVSQFKLDCDGGFCVLKMSEGGSSAMASSNGVMPILQTVDVSSVKVDASDVNNIKLVNSSSGEVLTENLTEDNLIIPLYYSEGYVLSIDGVSYRGGACFTKNSNGTVNLINCVSLDNYVCGVLPSEIGYSTPLESQKAQAVAARSFAMVAAIQGSSHSASGFDVCGSTHCQMYKGYSSESVESNKAVRETAGLCLSSGGNIVTGYYAKNAGGVTQNSENVWSGKVDYLKAVPDPYSPDYEWSKTYSFDTIETMLTKAGKNIGKLSSVEITKRADNGNVLELTFRGSDGTAVYKKSNIRSFFGSTELKSLAFAFDGTKQVIRVDKQGKVLSDGLEFGTGDKEGSSAGNGSNGKTTEGTLFLRELLMLGNGKSKSVGNNEITVLGAGGKTSKISKERCYAINGSGKVYEISSEKSSISNGNSGSNQNGLVKGDNGDGTYNVSRIIGSDTASGGTLNINGLGYGHGVGMQQDGAIAMGQLGWNYVQILEYYYTDIAVINIDNI